MVRTITIVTFGDSLTVGYTSALMVAQPYSKFLKDMTINFLKQIKMEDEIQFRFINRGVNGDLP